MGRREFVYTPEHGSRLNMAEIELRVLARPCLDRRLPDLDALRRAVAAWEADRNAAAVRVDRQFTTADARTKLKRLYPVLEPANSGVANHECRFRRPSFRSAEQGVFWGRSCSRAGRALAPRRP